MLLKILYMMMMMVDCVKCKWQFINPFDIQPSLKDTLMKKKILQIPFCCQNKKFLFKIRYISHIFKLLLFLTIP